MPAAGIVLIVAVVLIVLALVYYLVSTLVALKQIADGLDATIGSVVEIIDKSKPVNDVVADINDNLDAAVSALEGLLVKKAGMADAIGLVDGLYPGAGATGFREHGTIKAPRIAEVYTRGTLTLARLGREAPIAAASPAGGPVLRDIVRGSLAARLLYAGDRPSRSPIIGTDSPISYEAPDADASAV
jgi:FlaG/FlaF family flagellin (archaellin)